MMAERQKAANSLVCVGLDPLPEKLPDDVKAVVSRRRRSSDGDDWLLISHWMKKIVDATAPFTSLYKPQSAHYEAMPGGRTALRHIVGHIHRNHPTIPVFLDCKRGDIGRTQARYRVAHFEIDGVDGMNFSPYMGEDCMEYLVDEGKLRAIVGLCYTSNPSARQVQDLQLSREQTRKLGFAEERVSLWEAIAKFTMDWGIELGVNENTGLVMAAAYKPKEAEASLSENKSPDKVFSWHLKRGREIVGNKAWFLIPGIGTQGGEEKETVEAGYLGPGSVAINSSSDIIFASSGEDYAQAAAGKAEEMRDKLRAAVGSVA